MARKLVFYVSECLYCGEEFRSSNPRRLYCSTRCRRLYQNETRKAERQEIRDVNEASRWDYDPWQVDDRDNLENIFPNAIRDGWTGTPCGLTMCPEEAIGGAMACLSCGRSVSRADARFHVTIPDFGEGDSLPEPPLYGPSPPDPDGSVKRSATLMKRMQRKESRRQRRRRKRERSSEEARKNLGKPSVEKQSSRGQKSQQDNSKNTASF